MRKGQKHTAAARLKQSAATKARRAAEKAAPQETAVEKLRQRLRIPK